MGTDQDRDKLKRTFTDVGFKVHTKDDLTASNILCELRRFVTQCKSDCVIVCVLSHGNDGIVYGIDSEPVAIKDLEKEICVNDLADIPKILIIQACQGDEMQPVNPAVIK